MQFASTLGIRRLVGSAFAFVALLATGYGAANAELRAPATSFGRAGSGPPACARQRTTMTYGGHSQALDVRGGSFCIPAFGGFGGAVEYPGVERSVRLSLRTTTA